MQKVKATLSAEGYANRYKLLLRAEAQKGSGIYNSSYLGSQEEEAQLKTWKLDENLYKEHLGPHSSPPAHSARQLPSPPPNSKEAGSLFSRETEMEQLGLRDAKHSRS